MNESNENLDPTLSAIVRLLKSKYKCHTVLLYGSRARGYATPTSDYDVCGVCKTGKKTRIAKKVNGKYWDVFVYPERELTNLSNQHLVWKQARILYARGLYGRQLQKRIEKLLERPFAKHPAYEVKASRTWAQKQIERCEVGDTQSLFRRAELQSMLITDYFFVRQKRFWGPKEGLTWIESNDPESFQLIRRSLQSPTNLDYLTAAVSRVYRLKLKRRAREI